ncbi:MAG: hypothetical protein HQP61_08055 [Peptococcaceae bacterium]|nr:hypothetical protein [Candidatus Syntrophopropionicum ammoniitolerans]
MFFEQYIGFAVAALFFVITISVILFFYYFLSRRRLGSTIKLGSRPDFKEPEDE